MTTWIDTQDTEKIDAAVAAMRRKAGEGDRACGGVLDYAGGDEQFALWLRQIDIHVGKRLGLSVFDLPDVCWRDYFDDGLSPIEALTAGRAAMDL